MIKDHDIMDLQTIHSSCQCEITEVSCDLDRRSELHKDGCSIFVEGLVIALDCDKCEAFTENDTRPDIISIQECDKARSWLILEMKNTMRPRAAEQAKAALKRLGQDALFPIYLSHARVVFVIGKRRKADNTLMRDIGMIEVGQWRVVPRLLPSGGIVKCGLSP